MSFIELQERLAMLRVRTKSEEEARRDAIVRERAEAERALNDKLATVAQARAARQAQTAAARASKPNDNRKKPASAAAVAAADPRVAELQAQLEAKRSAVQAKKNRRVAQLA
jgi:hypothetical protein